MHKRWFASVLTKSAALRRVSSKGRSNPRMLKRRNSPYASNNRTMPPNQEHSFEPEHLQPLDVRKRSSRREEERGLTVLRPDPDDSRLMQKIVSQKGRAMNLASLITLQLEPIATNAA